VWSSGTGFESIWIRCVASSLLLAACARNSEAVAVPEPGPSTRPHAPAVAVDPVLTLPKPAETGSAEHGVVVLAEPVDTRAARRVVEAFFSAVVDESVDDLSLLCDSKAEARISARSRPTSLLVFWQKRFDRLDYRALSTEVFYRESEMEVHTARDASTVGLSRSVPMSLSGAEVLIRTPIVANSSRLFGSDLVFLLKPSPTGYKIAQVIEDFRLP